jgi:hypothetical protein
MEELIVILTAYVIISLHAGLFLSSVAVLRQLNASKTIRESSLIPLKGILYYFWAAIYWPKIAYKVIRKEPW